VLLVAGTSCFTGCISIPPLIKVEKTESAPDRRSDEIERRLDRIERKLDKIDKSEKQD
jgi:hypothetical protein